MAPLMGCVMAGHMEGDGSLVVSYKNWCFFALLFFFFDLVHVDLVL